MKSPERLRRGRGSASGVMMSEDQGVATILACVIGMALLGVTAIVLHLGSAMLSRQRAGVAADLAALAGAARLLEGVDIACAAANVVAASNGATLSACAADGIDLLVSTAVTVQLGPLTGQAIGRARAGPPGGVASREPP